MNNSTWSTENTGPVQELKASEPVLKSEPEPSPVDEEVADLQSTIEDLKRRLAEADEAAKRAKEDNAPGKLKGPQACQCGSGMYFIEAVQRYEPKYEAPDLQRATCVLCDRTYLRYREGGNWMFAAFNSLKVRELLKKSNQKKFQINEIR